MAAVTALLRHQQDQGKAGTLPGLPRIGDCRKGAMRSKAIERSRLTC
jgi:hypothetical protein